MPNVRVPREVLAGVKVIANLDDGTLSKIIQMFRSEAASLYPSVIARTLAAKIQELSEANAQAVIDCIIALELARASTSIPIAQLVSDVVASAKSEIPDESKQNRLTAWLQDALGIEPLMISAKGISVMQDNERTFFNARVITDIRPVYKEGLSETPKEPPSAAVIVHTLKIGFRESGHYNEFFVALDSEDLVKLKQALERAEAKTDTLQALLNSAKVNYLKVQVEQR